MSARLLGSLFIAGKSLVCSAVLDRFVAALGQGSSCTRVGFRLGGGDGGGQERRPREAPGGSGAFADRPLSVRRHGIGMVTLKILTLILFFVAWAVLGAFTTLDTR
jgi:hypothetical protein